MKIDTLGLEGVQPPTTIDSLRFNKVEEELRGVARETGASWVKVIIETHIMKSARDLMDFAKSNKSRMIFSKNYVDRFSADGLIQGLPRTHDYGT